MKKVLFIVMLFELIIFINPHNYLNCTSYADDFQKSSEEENRNKNEIINNQKDNLKISDFMKEAQEYTKESMPGVDLNNLLSTAISGGIDNVKLMKLFLSLFRKRSFKFSRNFKQYNCNCSNSFNIKINKRKPWKC